MLTAKSNDMDKINGLTLGADDYLTKPFNPSRIGSPYQNSNSSLYPL